MKVERASQPARIKITCSEDEINVNYDGSAYILVEHDVLRKAVYSVCGGPDSFHLSHRPEVVVLTSPGVTMGLDNIQWRKLQGFRS